MVRLNKLLSRYLQRILRIKRLELFWSFVWLNFIILSTLILRIELWSVVQVWSFLTLIIKTINKTYRRNLFLFQMLRWISICLNPRKNLPFHICTVLSLFWCWSKISLWLVLRKLVSLFCLLLLGTLRENVRLLLMERIREWSLLVILL